MKNKVVCFAPWKFKSRTNSHWRTKTGYTKFLLMVYIYEAGRKHSNNNNNNNIYFELIMAQPFVCIEQKCYINNYDDDIHCFSALGGKAHV